MPIFLKLILSILVSNLFIFFGCPFYSLHKNSAPMTHVRHFTLVSGSGCFNVVVVAEWINSRRVAHVLSTAVDWAYQPWPQQKISLVPSREPTHTMAPAKGLLVDKQKTPAPERHIAPRLRKG